MPHSFGRSIRRPEFCPNKNCPWHNKEYARATRWYQNYGTFYSIARGKTHRFICKSCGKTCSSQTFSVHYWTHRFIDLKDLDNRLNSCAGYRQIARALIVSYQVIRNRVLRLARNYLNIMDNALSHYRLTEDIAFDGIESYLRNQYTPVNFNIVVGCTSQVPYGFTLSLFRRRGRMTCVQKRNRTIFDSVWRPEPRSLINSCRTILRDALSLYINRGENTPFVINTDEKIEYKSALESLPEFRHLKELRLVSHVTTNSRAERTRKNPLFPVNYLDREIRKNSAAHARETVRADREISMSLARMAITLGHHTFRKPFRIKNRVHPGKTHADIAGLLDNIDTQKALSRLFTRRHVWSHQRLRAVWMEDIWLRKKKNPPVINFRTGIIPTKGQPGSGWMAEHLLC